MYFFKIYKITIRFSFGQCKWKETRMQLGKDYAHSIYQACNPDFRTNPKTLWTDWIPKQDAQEFLLDLSFAQEDQHPLHMCNNLTTLRIRTLEDHKDLFSGSESRIHFLPVLFLRMRTWAMLRTLIWERSLRMAFAWDFLTAVSALTLLRSRCSSWNVQHLHGTKWSLRKR